MQTPEELCSLTVTQVIALVKSNAITVEEYASALLSRVEKKEPVVKAWQYIGKHRLVMS